MMATNEGILLTKMQISDLARSSVRKMSENEWTFRAFLQKDFNTNREKLDSNFCPRKFIDRVQSNFETFCEKNRIVRSNLLNHINLNATASFKEESAHVDGLCKTFIEQIHGVDLKRMVEKQITREMANSKVINSINQTEYRFQDIKDWMENTDDDLERHSTKNGYHERRIMELDVLMSEMKEEFEEFKNKFEHDKNVSDV